MLRLLVVILGLAAAAPASAGDLQEFEKTVRTTDPAIRELIRDARASSPTLRRLIDRLQQSDIIVYVTRQYDMSVFLEGQLVFMTSAGEKRYVNVRLAWALGPRRMVAVLAHELQHAVEVAGAADVVDHASLARAYARIGRRGTAHLMGVQTFETQEAIEAENQAWREYEAATSADD